MVRIITVPFRVLAEKNMTEDVLCCIKLVPVRGKNIFEPRSSNEILVWVPNTSKSKVIPCTFATKSVRILIFLYGK